MTGVPATTCSYVVGGLVPLGGIVIGLALTLKRRPEMAPFADTLINVIIGSTVIHEFVGPLTAKWARELPPLIEVEASWSISLTRQVSPGSEGRSDLVSTKATLPC